MKKEYQSPELDVEVIDSDDIILYSNLTGNNDSPFGHQSLPERQDIFRI